VVRHACAGDGRGRDRGLDGPTWALSFGDAMPVAAASRSLMAQRSLGSPRAHRPTFGSAGIRGQAAGGGRRRAPAAVALPLVLVAFFLGTAHQTDTSGGWDVPGALVVGPILLLVSMPFLAAAGRREVDPAMGRLFKIALILKLAGSLVRYAVIFNIYGGISDLPLYHEQGLKFAPQIRHFDFIFQFGYHQGLVGNGFVQVLTGTVYALVGPTKLGGFLVFSWLGFWGMFLFYRAFCIAFPVGDRKRYALLVFFLPSLLFWPSSIGKDAWMMFSLGVAAYGAARVLTRERAGFALLGLGLAGAALVRPHVSAIIMIGLLAAYFFNRTPEKVSPLGPIAKVVGIVLLIGTTSILFRQTSDYLQVSSLNTTTVDQVQKQTQKLTSEGGSSFQTSSKGGLSALPLGIVTLLFRPFPFEVHSPQGLFASLEGVVLLGLFVRSRRRLRHFISMALRHTYLILVVVYSLVFIYAFSVISNFGIVSRQRAQLYPFFLVLLALPAIPRPPKVKRARSRGAARLGQPGRSPRR
jgi:hypothetical protein